MATTECIFCKIIEGKTAAEKLGENEDAIAISDLSPQAPLHALIISKKHYESLNSLNQSERQMLLPVLYDLADSIASEKGLRDRGYRTVINNQREAGQSVFHLHMHVLAGAQLRGTFGSSK